MKINEISENISHTSKRLRDIEREKKVKPGTDEWFKLWFSLPYLKEAKENIYDILEPEDCGPFDGGCVLVAQALQKIHGGDIVVLINDRGNADHAAVKIGNTLLDFDGPLPVDKFVKRFEKNEHVKITGIRPMKDSDLPEATRNQTLLPKIINLLSKGVKEAFSSEPDPTGYQHTALTNPQYSIIVNTPGELDWYKLGQHFATLGQQDPHEFGQPESDMMIVAPNKEQLMKYMQELDRLGATYKLTGGSHEHPEVHIESNAFTDSRMKAIKAGKKEFSVNGKTYPITGNIQDELEAKTNESIENFNSQEPMSSSVLIQGYGTTSLSTLMKNITNSIKELGELRNDPASFRQLKYALYDNGVLKAKLGALVTALDQLQEIKRKGGKRSVNIQKEDISEETGKEMLKIFRNMHHDTDNNREMDVFVKSHNWELRNFTPDMFPSEEEFFDYDDPFDRVIDIDYSHRVDLSQPIIVGPQYSDGKYSVIDGNHRAAAAQRMGKTIKGYFPVKNTTEARTFQPQMSPMQDLVAEYQMFSSFGQMGLSDYAKSSDSAEKIKEVIRTLAQSNKNLQNLDKQALEKNKNKILTHIHDMMNYAIAHFREHLKPEQFDAKKQQINKLLTKYNNLTSTNENFADGKNPGRKGLAKRMGVNTKASVSSLRKTAKNSSGEKQRMAHWLANMKSGREK